MSKVEQNILTEQQFKNSPFKNFMSYNDDITNALKLGSAFTFQRALNLQKSEDSADNIKNSVKGWALEKGAKKGEAEEKYYAALAQYEAMKNAQYSAVKRLKYTTNMYGEESSQYNDAFKKYDLSAKSLFGANVDLTCARDHFNDANSSAFKAFLTSRLADA